MKYIIFATLTLVAVLFVNFADLTTNSDFCILLGTAIEFFALFEVGFFQWADKKWNSFWNSL